MTPLSSAPDAIVRTARLVLRPWRDSDLAPFAAMNADPDVMAHMPSVLDRAASDAVVARMRDRFDRRALAPLAVEVPGVAGFIGFVGLSVPRFAAAFTPCVEVGWRLARRYWGCGYATEAAQAALAAGFGPHRLDAIVSFTVPHNVRSRGVMERLGMTHDAADDFDHPSLPEGHALRAHVLYRLSRARWHALRTASR